MGDDRSRTIRLPWQSLAREGRKRLEALEQNPVLWLTSRRAQGQVYLWLVVGLAGIFAFVSSLMAFVNHGQRSATEQIFGILFLSAIGLHLFLAFWVAAQASYSFANARASGALELLLSTPVTVASIVQGHFCGLRNVFLRPVLYLILIEICVITFGFGCFWKDFNLDTGTVLGFIYVGLLIPLFLLDLYAAGWFGLWMGLISKKPAHAVTKTSLFVLVLPYLFCGLPCYILWPFIGILKNWFFIVYAQGQFNRRFRAVVTEQFSAQTQGTLLPAPHPPPLRPQIPVNP